MCYTAQKKYTAITQQVLILLIRLKFKNAKELVSEAEDKQQLSLKI